jgi:hypothetical protein
MLPPMYNVKKKLFTSRVFVPGRPFQRMLMSVGKAWSLPLSEGVLH